MEKEEPTDHALQTLEASLERNPNNAQLRKAVAQLYLDRGIFFSRAQKVYEQVLESEPDNLDFHKVLSIAYLLQHCLKLSQEIRNLHEMDTTALETKYREVAQAFAPI